MKRLIALLLVLTMVFVFSACGDPEDTNIETPDISNSGTSSPDAQDQETGGTESSVEVDPNAPISEEMLRNQPVSPSSDFKYREEDGGIKITQYTGENTLVVIPSEIDGLPVTQIAYYAFGNDCVARGVWIPDTVKELGSVFTNNSSLEVVICEGVEFVIGFTFGYCESLHTVVFGNNLQEIQIDEGVGAFCYCPALKELYLPASVTKISSADIVFLWCEDLTLAGEAGSYIESYANENDIPFQVE